MPLSELIDKKRNPTPTAPSDHTKFYMEGEINKGLDQAGF